MINSNKVGDLKTMADKFMYNPNDDTQNYLCCRLNFRVETFEHSNMTIPLYTGLDFHKTTPEVS